MKERSLYFRGPTADAMVRAVLDGTKTQHRVPVKLSDPTATYAGFDDDGWPMTQDQFGDWSRDPSLFGEPGDRIRIKECWAVSVAYDSYGSNLTCNSGQVAYRAGGGFDFEQNERGRWRPSTHMPKWAERIVRPVKRVWIEHVQDIRREGALAEGHVGSGFGPRFDFTRLWDSIYASKGYGFGENPWVWGCEFEGENT